MGLFWKGIPQPLFPAIKKVLGPSFVAIETGTYKAETTKMLADFADFVITIEADFGYFQKSKETLQRFENVTILHGDSSVLIDDSRGLIGKSGWPLLSELIGLLSQNGFSSIIIDDVLIASSIESLETIAEDFTQSRTFIFEKLGGRMSLVTRLAKSFGMITSTAFKIKYANLLSKK